MTVTPFHWPPNAEDVEQHIFIALAFELSLEECNLYSHSSVQPWEIKVTIWNFTFAVHLLWAKISFIKIAEVSE